MSKRTKNPPNEEVHAKRRKAAVAAQIVAPSVDLNSIPDALVGAEHYRHLPVPNCCNAFFGYQYLDKMQLSVNELLYSVHSGSSLVVEGQLGTICIPQTLAHPHLTRVNFTPPLASECLLDSNETLSHSPYIFNFSCAQNTFSTLYQLLVQRSTHNHHSQQQQQVHHSQSNQLQQQQHLDSHPSAHPLIHLSRYESEGRGTRDLSVYWDKMRKVKRTLLQQQQQELLIHYPANGSYNYDARVALYRTEPMSEEEADTAADLSDCVFRRTHWEFELLGDDNVRRCGWKVVLAEVKCWDYERRAIAAAVTTSQPTQIRYEIYCTLSSDVLAAERNKFKEKQPNQFEALGKSFLDQLRGLNYRCREQQSTQ